MKKRIRLTKNSIRFRHWSRKAYAIFSSLGVCVTIGSLKTGVADCSLSKQKGKISLLSNASGDSFDIEETRISYVESDLEFSSAVSVHYFQSADLNENPVQLWISICDIDTRQEVVLPRRTTSCLF